MGFIGKRDSKNLKYFVNAPFQFQVVLNYCNKAVSDYSTVELNAYRVFGSSPKLLDFKMLFYPFEEQLDAPSVTVKHRNSLRRSSHIIGQEDVSCTIFRVEADHFPYLFWVILGAFIDRERPNYIGDDTFRKPSYPCSWL